MDTKPTTEELRQRLRVGRLERLQRPIEERLREGDHLDEAMRNGDDDGNRDRKVIESIRLASYPDRFVCGGDVFDSR